MDVNEAIGQLGEKLDEWCDANLATFTSADRHAQANAFRDGIKIMKELERAKTEGVEALASLLNGQVAISKDERVTSLIRGFAFGAKLADTLHDELLDTDGETKVVHLMNRIADSLDAIRPGRASLAVLLDDPDARVRASAGAYHERKFDASSSRLGLAEGENLKSNRLNRNCAGLLLSASEAAQRHGYRCASACRDITGCSTLYRRSAKSAARVGASPSFFTSTSRKSGSTWSGITSNRKIAASIRTPGSESVRRG